MDFSFLWNIVDYALSAVYNLGIDVAQAGIDGFGSVLELFISYIPTAQALPDVPVLGENALFEFFIDGMNWIFPVQYMLNLLAWVTSMCSAWLIVAPILRWFI